MSGRSGGECVFSLCTIRAWLSERTQLPAMKLTQLPQSPKAYSGGSKVYCVAAVLWSFTAHLLNTLNNKTCGFETHVVSIPFFFFHTKWVRHFQVLVTPVDNVRNIDLINFCKIKYMGLQLQKYLHIQHSQYSIIIHLKLCFCTLDKLKFIFPSYSLLLIEVTKDWMSSSSHLILFN